MNELQVFTNPEFGQVRTVTIEEEPWFVGKDVAVALGYLRDIAEREAINRFTTAEIKVEQHNENHISKDADLDGIMDAWANDFAEKLEVSEEGVHE